MCMKALIESIKKLNTKQKKTTKTTPSAPGNRKFRPLSVLIALVLVYLFISFNSSSEVSEIPEKGNEISYSDLAASSNGFADEAWVFSAKDMVILSLSDKTSAHTYYPTGGAVEVSDSLRNLGVQVNVVAPESPNIITSLLFSLLPIFLVVGVLILINKKGVSGIMSQVRNKSTPVEVPPTRFTDVAGIDEVLEDLKEVVEFLNNPDRYSSTGATSPRGFLLVGPPGTGKTLVARAVAGEAGVPFYAITGSDFVEMFVGVGAARVRDLFAKARAQTKAIVFIDEIDAIGRARGKGGVLGSNDERENTLNALLVELDGFARHSGIVVLAATNRADVLDPALLRPGRFDKILTVSPPDRAGRVKIMELYSKNKPFMKDIDWVAISKRVPGLTGAQIEQLLNESALEAARNSDSIITSAHIESALASTILGRERKSSVLSERDREIVAWHEAGHAAAAMLLPKADDPVYISIIPRGASGGSTWMSGNEHDLTTRSQMLARLVVSLSGRAAEEILLEGDYTQGAHGDLVDATALSTAMVTKFGMGSKLSWSPDEKFMFDGPVGARVETEINDVLENAMMQSRDLLTQNRQLVQHIATNLLEKETLNLQDISEIRSLYVS